MKRQLRFILAGFTLGTAALTSGGCADGQHATGTDNAFLTAPLVSGPIANSASDDLLPLVAGNTWQMRSVSAGKHSMDVLTIKEPPVSGPQNSVTATVEILRDGSPWRREQYKEDPTGIYLVQMKDEVSPLMTFAPAIPIVKYQFKEGQYWHWIGTVSFDKSHMPADAYSRVSALESIDCAAGRFKALRVDTIVSMTTPEREFRFPMVRWLAPRVGFVRRGFAEKGLPAFSELTSFNVH